MMAIALDMEALEANAKDKFKANCTNSVSEYIFLPRIMANAIPIQNNILQVVKYRSEYK
jgi:hypothetical protein